jgi:hypothetical protein
MRRFDGSFSALGASKRGPLGGLHHQYVRI